MKSQKNFIKNINNNLTLIKVVSNPNLHNSMINNYWRKYEGGNRVYSTNFFTPEVMSNVLQLLTENNFILKLFIIFFQFFFDSRTFFDCFNIFFNHI